MVLDTSLLNTQQYKVRIKSKADQSKERSSALPLHLGVVAVEKGAFGSPSTMVANFTLFTFRRRRKGFQTSRSILTVNSFFADPSANAHIS